MNMNMDRQNIINLCLLINSKKHLFLSYITMLKQFGIIVQDISKIISINYVESQDELMTSHNNYLSKYDILNSESNILIKKTLSNNILNNDIENLENINNTLNKHIADIITMHTTFIQKYKI